MKKLLRLLLFGKAFFREYPAVAIDEGAIGEKVFFETGGMQSDVSQKHWLLSLEPMVYGIWSENKTTGLADGKLIFHSGHNQKVAVANLKLSGRMEEKEGALFLFEVQKSQLFYGNNIRIKLVFNWFYKKPGMDFGQFKNLAAAFSYPRKVRLVSFQKAGCFNLFPMDLVGIMPNTDYMVFGLRHSNAALSKIIAEKKLAVAEFPATLKNEVYQLAKHHSSNPPSREVLPFEVVETEKYRFPVPKAAVCYHETEIIQTIDLGSHILLWAKKINKVQLNENAANLYHIHFLAHCKYDNQYRIV